jgi:hypothetical protein
MFANFLCWWGLHPMPMWDRVNGIACFRCPVCLRVRER